MNFHPITELSFMIDSHCHLADKAFDADRAEVIQRATDAGVSQLVTIADTFLEGEKCLDIAAKYGKHPSTSSGSGATPGIFCTIGVHPHHAKDWKSGDGDRLKTMLMSSPTVKAVGEIGLDYHYDFSPREVQRDVFREQLLLAKELHLPAVVHCREAIDGVRAIIEEVDAGPFVLHCCTEKWDDVSWVIERVSLLSFTGIATFPKSDVIRDTIKHCPLASMMVETDAPYLAPIPYRGKRCEPMHVIDTAKFIAAQKGISLEEFEKATTQTTMAFFRLPS